MRLNIPNYINEIFNLINSKYPNSETYVVGGATRDILLDVTPHDYDLTTSLSIDEIRECFNGYKLYNDNGLKHGTISLLFDGNEIEISTFKGNSVLEDAKNRDFTINAIYYNEKNGLVDPLNGKEDILNKVIRAVTNPKIVFENDKIRPLRALRFASTLSFKIEEETAKTIHDQSFLLSQVSVERINKELCTLICGDNAYNVLSEYKDILAVIIPELKTIIGYNQKNYYHTHQDLYEHTINVLKNCSKSYITRIAALLHDIGKPECYSEEDRDGVIFTHFYKHPLVSKNISTSILNNLKFSKKDMEVILFLIENHDNFIPSKRAPIKRLLNRTPYNNPEYIKMLLDLRIADYNDHKNLSPDLKPNDIEIMAIISDILASNEVFKIKDLALKGNDIQKLGFAGEEIGLVKEFLFNLMLDGELNNTKEDLLDYLIKNINKFERTKK